MTFFDCILGFLVVVGALLLFSLIFIIFCLIVFFVSKSIGCYEDFVKKEDLKPCCFDGGKK